MFPKPLAAGSNAGILFDGQTEGEGGEGCWCQGKDNVSIILLRNSFISLHSDSTIEMINLLFFG